MRLISTYSLPNPMGEGTFMRLTCTFPSPILWGRVCERSEQGRGLPLTLYFFGVSGLACSSSFFR